MAVLYRVISFRGRILEFIGRNPSGTSREYEGGIICRKATSALSFTTDRSVLYKLPFPPASRIHSLIGPRTPLGTVRPLSLIISLSFPIAFEIATPTLAKTSDDFLLQRISNPIKVKYTPQKQIRFFLRLKVLSLPINNGLSRRTNIILTTLRVTKFKKIYFIIKHIKSKMLYRLFLKNILLFAYSSLIQDVLAIF